MKVPFYGHVRQYHNIKAEIDANMQGGAGERRVRDGPDAQALREGAGRLLRHEARDRRQLRHRRPLARRSWRWASARATRCITTTNTFFATAEAIWIAGATAVFVDSRSEDQQHRPDQDRSRHHAEDQGHHPGPPLRPVRRHEGHPRHRREAQAVRRSRTTRRPSTPRGDGFKHRRAERRRLHQLHHPEEPGHLRRRRRGGHQPRGHRHAVVRRLRNHGSRQALRATAWASTAAWTTCTPASSASS